MFLRSQKTSEEIQCSGFNPTESNQENVAETRLAESVLGDGSLAQRESISDSAEFILGDGNLAQIQDTTRVAISGRQQLSSERGSGDSTAITMNAFGRPASVAPVCSSQQPVITVVETSNSQAIQPLRPDELSSMLPTFSGYNHEDVNHFLKTLSNTKQALNVNDQTMKIVLFKLLKGIGCIQTRIL